MQIHALVRNAPGKHEAIVATAGTEQHVPVPAKTSGHGSAVNGGEFLMLALATCYCNDLYREAAKRNIVVQAVEVQASAEFAGVGLAATGITYRAKVQSPAPAAVIAELLRETDAVAEVHNTLRAGAPVELLAWRE